MADLTGTKGNDKLKGTNAADNINGGLGNDNIDGLGGDDYLFGERGNDKLKGGGGTDFISGDAGNDNLNGGAGLDVLSGEEGNDTLIGGAGDDFLTGFTGKNRLTGGAGKDYYLYGNTGAFKKEVGQDIITDFNTRFDSFYLNNKTFDKLTGEGTAQISLLKANNFATVTSDRKAATSKAFIVYNKNNGKLFYNENGTSTSFGNGGLFAKLSNKASLNSDDFTIFTVDI